MNFEEAKKQRDALWEATRVAGKVLNAFPKDGPMGLTSDAVRATPEWKKANADFQRAFQAQRNFNGTFVKIFAKELRAERRARWQAGPI